MIISKPSPGCSSKEVNGVLRGTPFASTLAPHLLDVAYPPNFVIDVVKDMSGAPLVVLHISIHFLC